MWILYKNIYNEDAEYSHKLYYSNGCWLINKESAQKFENYYLAESALGDNKDYVDWYIERFID